MVAVTDEVGGRRIAELPGKVAGHDLGLTDVRIVLRLIAVGVVIGFRRDIPGLLPDAREEALGAVPDGVQLTVLQRRHTLGGLVQESLIRLIGITVLFDDATGEAGHGGVSAALRDNGALTKTAVRQLGIEIVLLQKLGQVHPARIQRDLCCGGAEEEPGRVECIGIKVRENGIDQLLHIAVERRVGHIVDGKEHMEFGSRSLSVFLPHIEAAEMDGKGDAGKLLENILRSNPVLRVLRVVVVTIHREAVAPDEVVAVAVAVLVLGADIIVADGCLQRGFVQHNMLVRIGAVAGIAGDVGTINREHQSYTSAASSSSTFVMNFSARIVVSSSQSPPRTTSKPGQPYLLT